MTVPVSSWNSITRQKARSYGLNSMLGFSKVFSSWIPIPVHYWRLSKVDILLTSMNCLHRALLLIIIFICNNLPHFQPSWYLSPVFWQSSLRPRSIYRKNELLCCLEQPIRMICQGNHKAHITVSVCYYSILIRLRAARESRIYLLLTQVAECTSPMLAWVTKTHHKMFRRFC